MGNEGKFTEQVEANFWNKKSVWKVYSRRTKNNDKDVVKGKTGKMWVENFDFEDWHELEDQYIDSCQSSSDSSSDISESDKEALEVEEMNSEKIREVAEEAGLEGLRCLMNSRVMEERHKINEDERIERSDEALEKCLMETQVMEMEG